MTPEEARAVMAARTEGPLQRWYDDYEEATWCLAPSPEGHIVASSVKEADARAIVLAVNTWDALMAVADAAQELLAEPFDLDRLRDALDALDARLEAER